MYSAGVIIEQVTKDKIFDISTIVFDNLNHYHLDVFLPENFFLASLVKETASIIPYSGGSKQLDDPYKLLLKVILIFFRSTLRGILSFLSVQMDK